MSISHPNPKLRVYCITATVVGSTRLYMRHALYGCVQVLLFMYALFYLRCFCLHSSITRFVVRGVCTCDEYILELFGSTPCTYYTGYIFWQVKNSTEVNLAVEPPVTEFLYWIVFLSFFNRYQRTPWSRYEDFESPQECKIQLPTLLFAFVI